MIDDRDDVSDPALAALLREGADEAPPAHVDAAIRAAARRAAGQPRRRASLSAPIWRWLLPLGAAATIAAIMVGVQPVAPTKERLSAADNAAQVKPTPPVAPEAAPATRAERATAKVAAPAIPPQQNPNAAAALADAPRADVAREAQDAADVAREVQTRRADAWIDHIRQLRSHGRIDEAVQELARFRAAYADADARLPEDLRQFAAAQRAKPAAAPR